jgi:hypothetical protein
MTTILQTLQSFTGGLGKGTFTAHKGELIESDHPAVRQWPEKFGPLTVQHRVQSKPVEQATAAPGEKRGTR